MDRNLKAFLAVATTENLTEAAELIGLTQPSLTKRLHNLEADLGSRLFERHRRGMTLTETGKRFLRRARRIERGYLQAREEVQSRENAGMDVLRIGAGPLFHLRYVAKAFAQLNREFPLLRLHLGTDINEGNLPRLLAGELDIVLGVLDYPAAENGLIAYPMTTVEQGVIFKDPPATDTITLDNARLHDLAWILYSDDKGNANLLTQYFTENDLGAPRISVRTGSFTAGLQLVASGGYAMMAPIQLSPLVAANGLKIVALEPPLSRRSAGAYVRESATGFTAVMRFLEILAAQTGESTMETLHV